MRQIFLKIEFNIFIKNWLIFFWSNVSRFLPFLSFIKHLRERNLSGLLLKLPSKLYLMFRIQNGPNRKTLLVEGTTRNYMNQNVREGYRYYLKLFEEKQSYVQQNGNAHYCRVEANYTRWSVAFSLCIPVIFEHIRNNKQR